MYVLEVEHMDSLDNHWTRIDTSLRALARDTEQTIKDMEAGKMKATPTEITFMKNQLVRLTKAHRLVFKQTKA
jgi:hypothetical protein